MDISPEEIQELETIASMDSMVGDILVTAGGYFIMIFLAYFMKKKGILSLKDKDFIGTILLNVCLPCVIVMSFQSFAFDVSMVIALLIGMGANFTGIFVGYALSRKKSKEDQALFMVLTAGYNIGIFTIPFVSSFFTASAVMAVLMFDVGNAIFVMGTSAAIISGILNQEKGNPLPAILNKMLHSPTILTYIALFSVIGMGFDIPEEVFTIADIPSRATSFLAMTMVGIMIEFKIEKSEKKELLGVLGLRYGYAFAMSALLFAVLPFEVEIKKALMIGVLSPMSTASMVFAQKLGCKPSLVGGAGTFSILFSMIFIVGVSVLL